jgi:hypothetical protein
MKMLFAIATLGAALLGCGSTLAQVGAMGTQPLAATSPLAMGTSAPVGSTGVPLGATELAAPGTSPAPPATMGMMGCSSPGGSTSQTATALFDGGGMAGASSSCAGAGGAVTGGAGADGTGSSMPHLSTLQAGRANIPLGSTELASPGLSPLPPVSTTFVSPITPSITAPLSTLGASPSVTATPPCPVTGTFADGVTTRQTRQLSSSSSSAGPGC